MTRADYSALSGTVTLNMPGTGCNGPTVTSGCVPGSGTGGNPNLAPIVSNNVDGTIEWYFAPHSLLSASLFEMDLTSYVGYGTTLESFQSAGGNGVSAGSVQPYYITTEVNISAIVKGIELAYEQPIGKNFGMATNYTYINAADADGNPVVGASKNTANISGYYEDNHFNARLAYTWRSSFYSGLDRSTAFFQDSTGTLAATLGYKYNDNIAFTLDGMNLNNPILKYYGQQGESQPERFYENGRQYYLNVHLKY
jgi:iron complex outermembrane receptor protein